MNIVYANNYGISNSNLHERVLLASVNNIADMLNLNVKVMSQEHVAVFAITQRYTQKNVNCCKLCSKL